MPRPIGPNHVSKSRKGNSAWGRRMLAYRLAAARNRARLARTLAASERTASSGNRALVAGLPGSRALLPTRERTASRPEAASSAALLVQTYPPGGSNLKVPKVDPLEGPPGGQGGVFLEERMGPLQRPTRVRRPDTADGQRLSKLLLGG